LFGSFGEGQQGVDDLSAKPRQKHAASDFGSAILIHNPLLALARLRSDDRFAPILNRVPSVATCEKIKVQSTARPAGDQPTQKAPVTVSVGGTSPLLNRASWHSRRSTAGSAQYGDKFIRFVYRKLNQRG
jgi:hypothetical protein